LLSRDDTDCDYIVAQSGRHY